MRRERLDGKLIWSLLYEPEVMQAMILDVWRFSRSRWIVRVTSFTLTVVEVCVAVDVATSLLGEDEVLVKGGWRSWRDEDGRVQQAAAQSCLFILTTRDCLALQG